MSSSPDRSEILGSQNTSACTNVAAASPLTTHATLFISLTPLTKVVCALSCGAVSTPICWIGEICCGTQSAARIHTARWLVQTALLQHLQRTAPAGVTVQRYEGICTDHYF